MAGLVAILVIALGSSAFGQALASRSMAARRGSSTINQTLNTGAFGQGFSSGTGFSGSFSRATSGSGFGGNLANTSASAFSMGRSNGRSLSQFVPGTRSTNLVGLSPMLSYFGRSANARWFARNTFDGRGRATIPNNVTYGDALTTKTVLGTQVLAFKNAYHHRLFFQDTEIRGIRDELTNKSLENPVELPSNFASPDYNNRTHGQRMAALLDASRKKYLTDAWAYMAKGDYLRSKGLFDNALLVDREAPEPMVGKLLCAAAKQEIQTAGVYLSTLAQHENLFAHRYPLSQVYPDVDQADLVISWISSTVSARPDSDTIAALQVHLLWMDGRDAAALAAAQRLRKTFRASPYANFVDLIQTQMRADEESVTQRNAQDE